MRNAICLLLQPCRPVKLPIGSARYLSTNSAINKVKRKDESPPKPRKKQRRAPKRPYDRPPGRAEHFHRRPSQVLSVPYTSPISEFLYGASVVKAALQAKKRSFYKLYAYDGHESRIRGQDPELRQLAQAIQVPLHLLKDEEAPIMNKMTAGRPHNGYVLEATPLPLLIAESLGLPTDIGEPFTVVPGQKRPGSFQTLDCTSKKRFPFILHLDNVVDEGNLGAILRTALYFGVDAVSLSGSHAPMSPQVLQASAGAAEFIPILKVAHPDDFFQTCSTQGWKIYAGVSADSVLNQTKAIAAGEVRSPLASNGTILLLGNEGRGIPRRLQALAHHEISLPASSAAPDMIDSLNVSVAAALLCNYVMQGSSTAKVVSEERRLF